LGVPPRGVGLFGTPFGRCCAPRLAACTSYPSRRQPRTPFYAQPPHTPRVSKQVSNLRWQVAQAAEIRWWQRYLKDKNPDEYLRWKKAYWRQLLDQLPFAVQPHMRILDAGCGPAGIFTVLDTCNVTAVDPLLSQYTEKLHHFSPSMYPSVQFVGLPLEKYSPSPATFQVVFCLNVINHVQDIEASLRTLTQSIQPQGWFVLSVDAHKYNFLKWIFKLLPGDILHPHQYNLDEYKAMLGNMHIDLHEVRLYKPHPIFDYYLLIGQKKG
jgi:2-polyprenyl-3-methyl-5-hydroxy-6-metoxy-1,4-benzoquinol methylase